METIEAPVKTSWDKFVEKLRTPVYESPEGFKFNSCGSCMNPEIVYFFCLPEDVDGWKNISIKVACNNGTWDYGYSTPSSGSNPGLEGQFKSKEEAIKKAIERVSEDFKGDHYGLGDFTKHKLDFTNWLRGRKQLSLF